MVFFGTSRFSAALLESLYKLPNVELKAIVTRTDKPRGRNLKLCASPVKETASLLCPEIPILQPEKASSKEFCQTLEQFDADLFFVVAYGEILKQNVLDIPKKTSVNVHTSLLPKLRGAAPIQRSIMTGDPETGVSFMEMVLQMDAGDVFLQEKVTITPDMNSLELEKELLEASKKRLPEFISNFDQYYLRKKAQNEGEVTYAHKILSEDVKLDLSQDRQVMHNQIRALSPQPGVYVRIELAGKDKRLKILKTELINIPQKEKGLKLYQERGSLYLQGECGTLKVVELQLEGKKAMSSKDFVRGAPNEISILD